MVKDDRYGVTLRRDRYGVMLRRDSLFSLKITKIEYITSQEIVQHCSLLNIEGRVLILTQTYYREKIGFLKKE